MTPAEALLRVRDIMARDSEMSQVVAAMIRDSKTSGLAGLTQANPDMVVALAESWTDIEETPQFSGDPETGKEWT